jgi:hypothetical protein
VSARSKTPTQKGAPPPSTDERTRVYRGPEDPGESAERLPRAPSPPIVAVSHAKSEPIKAISMKTPDGEVSKRDPEAPVLPAVKLRAMSEFHRAQTPQNLGNLAPPYDPHEARKRSVQDYVIWGCLAVMMASAIALAVWFAAR